MQGRYVNRDVGGSNLMTEAQQLNEECDEHTHTDTNITDKIINKATLKQFGPKYKKQKTKR